MLTIRSSDIDLYPGSQEERLPGFSAQFPHICSHVLLPDGPAGACTWHWHKSMELFYVEKGALVYHTPGGQRLFRAGSGGMVNSNVLHRTQSLKNGTALRLHLFEAELLAGVPGGTVQQRYITPLVQRPGLELLALSPEVPGQAAALDLLRQSLYLDEDAFGYELRMLQWSRKKTSSYFIINQSRACSFGGRPCFGMVVTGTLAQMPPFDSTSPP